MHAALASRPVPPPKPDRTVDATPDTPGGLPVPPGLPAPWRRAAQAAFAAAALATGWFAFTPDPPPGVSGGWDKWNHLLAFAVLSSLATLGWTTAHRRHRVVAAGLVGYGVLIEVVQAFVPGRSAELADVVADAAGIALGLALASLGLSRRGRLIS